MTGKHRGHWLWAIGFALPLSFISTGCQLLPQECDIGKPLACDTCPMNKTPKPASIAPVARELNKVALPPYVIEPPDVLTIDAPRVVPLPPYRIEPLDGVIVQVSTDSTKPSAPIAGVHVVEPGGTINLGPSCGTIRIAGLTLDEASRAVESQTKKVLKAPQVSLALAESRAMQQVRGQHLVRQDGTIGLGIYGSVYVAGMTLADAKSAIEEHLAAYVLKPEVCVDVAGYNSKVCYIITDSGSGKQIIRVPMVGSETVLDALSHVPGPLPVSAHCSVWIARPAPAETGGKQILPVDLVAITEEGSTATNYQVMPGDRIFVRAGR